jgi:hypothetical protein
MRTRTQWLVVLLGVTWLVGCKTVTVASPSNNDVTQGMPFFSNAPLIEVGLSRPTEKIHFSGVNVGNGRWALIQEIETITQEALQAYQQGKSSIGKYDAMTLLAQLGLVLARTVMAFEGGQRMATAEAEATSALPSTLSPEAKAVLEKALSELQRQMRAGVQAEPPPPGEDGILKLLTDIRDVLRKMQQSAEPGPDARQGQ